MYTVIVMHSIKCIEPSLHKLDFFLDIFLWRLASVLDELLSICYAVAPMHTWLMSHPRTCAPTNGFQQPVHSAPSVFPAKVQAVSSSYARSKAQMHHPPENFLTIGCYFNYRVMALGWLKKEEERKKKRR